FRLTAGPAPIPYVPQILRPANLFWQTSRPGSQINSNQMQVRSNLRQLAQQRTVAGPDVDHAADPLLAIDQCRKHLSDHRPTRRRSSEMDPGAVQAPKALGPVRSLHPGVEPRARSPRRGRCATLWRMREHGPMVPDGGSMASSPVQANPEPSFPALPPLPSLPQR